MLNGLKGPFRIFIFYSTIVFFANNSFAQTRAIDSMRTHLKDEILDSMKVKTMNLMSYYFYIRETYDSAKKYGEQALSLATNLKYKIGMVVANENVGSIAFRMGKYSDALQIFLQAYQIANEINYMKGISHVTNDLGLLAFYTGDYPSALKYYIESIKIKEKLGNKEAIANTYNNMVDVYTEEGDIEDGRVYLNKVLKIDHEINDSLGLAFTYASLGDNYLRSAKVDSALFFENKANEIGKILNSKIVEAYSSAYLGDIFMNEGKKEDAFTSYQKALAVADSINDKEIIAMVYFNLGEVCVKLQRFPEASSFYAQSLDIAKKINDKKKIMQGYLALTHYDSISGNQNAVLSHYKLYITYRDSIFSVSAAHKIENEKLTYENEEQQALAKKDFENKQAIAKEESEKKIQRQKILRDVFIGGFGLALIFSLVFFRQRVRIGKEKKRSEDLLLNILPAETAEELKSKGSTVAKDYDMVTVLFTDFKNFTAASEKLNAQELVNEINYCYSEFDRIVTKFGIEKIKTIGDGYMAAGGLPVKNTTNAEDAVRAALAIRDFIEEEKQSRISQNKPYFEIRIGLHTGHIVAGVVGIKKFAYDIWGDTVNIASRMESSGEPGKVNISGTTYEFVKDKFKCNYRGKVQAKNKGEIDMYFVEG